MSSNQKLIEVGGKYQNQSIFVNTFFYHMNDKLPHKGGGWKRGGPQKKKKGGGGGDTPL